MQLSRVDFYNSAVQSVRNITDIYCSPLRSIMPGSPRVDLASLIMAVVIQAAGIYLVIVLIGNSNSVVSLLVVPWAMIAVAGLILRLYFIFLILNVIFSWVRPQGVDSWAELSNQIIAPLLRPFHKFVPPMAGLDFSPMALFFLIYLLQNLWRSFAISMDVPLNIIFGI